MDKKSVIKAIIIDFGGVLLRTEDRTPRLMLAARFGLTYEEIDRLVFSSSTARMAALGMINTHQHWEDVCKKLNLAPEKLDEIRREFFAGDQLDMELVELLRNLREKFRIALLSNAWSDLRAEIEANWKISDAFDVIVLSAEEGIAKPDPKIFKIVVDKLNVKPDQVLFIDDFVENIDAAKQYGFNTIYFDDPIQIKRELSNLLN